MTRKMSRLAAAALSIAGVAACSGTAAVAAEYPTKPVSLIVAYGAGGGTDVTARLLAKDLEKELGQPVTVQNVTGGGGWTGWGALAKAEPDGYTIGYINIPNMFAGYLDPKIGRPESLDSFTLLMNHVTDYCVWAVKDDSPHKTVSDVIEAAKSGAVSITAHGHGNDDHLAILSMQKANGVEFKVVHNQSTSESKAQVLGGHVDVLGANVSEVISGELRVIGVMSDNRSEFLPEVATFKEQGFDQNCSVSRGIAGPKGLPSDITEKITAALEKTLASDEHRKAAKDLGLAIEVVKGQAYIDFLKKTEAQIKELMGW